jgi:hypothetical protein
MRQNEPQRTVVRTTLKKAVRNARSACAAAVPCGTAGPQKAVSLTAYFGAYRTTSFTKGAKWYGRGVARASTLAASGQISAENFRRRFRSMARSEQGAVLRSTHGL